MENKVDNKVFVKNDPPAPNRKEDAATNGSLNTNQYYYALRNTIKNIAFIIKVYAENIEVADRLINKTFDPAIHKIQRISYGGEVIQHNKQEFARINLKPYLL